MPRISPLAYCVLLLVSPIAQALTDTNLNSLSDEWEKAWNNGQLFPPSFDPQADPDGDGWKNITESIAGTNPFDSRAPTGIIIPEISATPANYEAVEPSAAPAEPQPTDPFTPTAFTAAATPILLDPSVVTLTWPTIPGKTYRAHLSENLLTWTPASETFLGSGVPMTYQTEPLNTDGTIPGKLFWRIETGDTDTDGDNLTDYEEIRRNLDPFSPDTDRDGIRDDLDAAPLVSATLADPDGLGLANANLLTGLKANWTFEETSIPIVNLFGKNEASCGNHAPATTPSWPVLVPFGMNGTPAFLRRGFVSRGIPLADKSIFGDGKVFTGITNTFTLSFWHRFDKDSIRDGNAIYKCLWSLSDCRPAQGSIKSNTLAIRRKSATEEEIYLGAYAWDSGGGNPDSTLLGKTFTRPLGTADDGKWHQYTIVRANGKYTLLIDGHTMPVLNDATTPWLTIPLNKTAPTTPTDYTYDWNTFGRMAPSLPQNQTIGTFDRIRLWSRPLNTTETTGLFREDLDKDGLWDISENNTVIWYDLNKDNIREQGEYQFRSSPFLWEDTIRDTDGDGLSDLDEQNIHHTDIAHPDTDGDLLPDGWEVEHNLNALIAAGNHGKDGDPDSDGATNLQEYSFASDPNITDTDGDGTDDGPEIANGSNPSDSRDNGQPLTPGKSVAILLGVGDQSGSNSEDYNLNIFRIDPLTGDEFRFHTHRSGGHGSYFEVPRSIFHKGETYTFQLDWQSSTQGSSGHDPNAPEKGPDYDYTLKIQPQTAYLGKLIESYDPATGTTDLNNPLPGTNRQDVAATQPEFEANYESRRVAIVSPKLIWEEIEDFGNLSAHVDPWNHTEKGKRIFPCRKNPDDNQIRHKLRLVATGGLKGIECFVKSFDIDDSTDEGFDLDIEQVNPVIDTNGELGADNLTDYLETLLTGQFWIGSQWGPNSFHKPFDANGRASFDFRVGMQPGNNYRAAASVIDESGYENVQVLLPETATYLGFELPHDGAAIVSEPLTVWRRLWVENDSMGAIPTHPFGYPANDLSWDLGANNTIKGMFPNSSNTESTFSLPHISDLSSFVALENGRFIIQSVVHPVTGTFYGDTAPNGNTPPVYHVKVTGNHPTPNGSGFRLFDDDGYGLANPVLPRNDLVNDELVDVYKPAFIQIIDAGEYNLAKTVDFSVTHEPVVGGIGNYNYGVLDDALDPLLEGGANLWIASCVIAYQPGTFRDNDPNDELETIAGATVGDSLQFSGHGRVSVIYSETIRDGLDGEFRNSTIGNFEYERRLRLTIAHEIGHQPLYQQGEGQHSEEGLMQVGGHQNTGVIITEFSATSAKRFRSVFKWRQKE